MSLAELQRDMRAWLVEESADAAARLGAGAAPGLRVYQNNYRAQLVACLESSFGQTRAWIGHEAFLHAVVVHVDRVPPSSWTLDAYPRDFPETLAQLYPDDPEVAELGWIDRALGEAFVGPDAPVVRPEAMAAVDWDQAVLRFTPTLDMAPLTTNAPAIWGALAQGEDPPAAEMLPDIGAVLVWRQDMVSRYRAIDAAERDALAMMRGGTTFAALCTGMVGTLGEADGIARAGALLGQWLGDGLISAIVEPDSP